MKRFLSLLLLGLMLFLLFACGKTEPTSDRAATDTATASSEETVKTTEKKIERKKLSQKELKALDYSEGNYVLATDQRAQGVFLYDLSRYEDNLEQCEIWRYKNSAKAFSNPSGIKYRTNTVYGDVVLVCASGGFAGVVSFPEGKLLWSVNSCGHNPHSIEILPDGAVVTACSTGSEVRIYNPKATSYSSISFNDAHAVLWDPKYEWVWVLGGSRLNAYKEVERNGLKALELVKQYTSNSGGHECSADFSDPDYLFCTAANAVIRINKQTGERTELKIPYSTTDCKGYGNNKLGNYFYCKPNQGPGTKWEKANYAEWCTDTIFFLNTETMKIKKLKSTSSAYYKVFSFCGDYQ